MGDNDHNGSQSGGINGSINRKVDFRCRTHEMNNIQKVIAVVSGKGGVGKSLVTSLLAVMTRKKGYNVGILDADITGPSIPKVFGVDGMAEGNESGIFPIRTHNNIKIMSINLLLQQSDAPAIWRAPIITSTVKQFWTDVIWGDLEFLYIDMPPGTGDVPLTVFQSIPLSGIIIVTTPQDLVSLIVTKAYNMAKMMNIPILGIIENMSYVLCPHCGEKINIFGGDRATSLAEKLGTKLLGRIPIDSELAKLCDAGEIERSDKDYLNEAVNSVEQLL